MREINTKIIFISYSHDSEEHRDQVLALSERLRKDGLETRLDRYVNGTPAEGWPRWMLNKLDKGSRYFCERFFRDPARKISKNYATTNAFGCPSRPRFSRFRP